MKKTTTIEKYGKNIGKYGTKSAVDSQMVGWDWLL